MAQLAIKGHPTKGKEVIEIFKMLGGKDVGYNGVGSSYYYYINSYDNIIGVTGLPDGRKFVVYTLEEFLEKFPYKVGDKVRVAKYELEVRIDDMKWDGNEVQYKVFTDETEWYSAKELNLFNEPYKEETMEEIKIDIPKGYEFVGVDDDKQQVVFTKIKPQYPKTYGGCCNILKYSGNYYIALASRIDDRLFEAFYKLKVCRDAYWTVAGDWRPDFTNNDEEKYSIYTAANKVVKDFCGVGDVNTILTFPTEEMRDAFYENFKDLIEECKELL